MAFTFPFIFLFGLSCVLLLGSILIWKSGLPDNDKIMAIIFVLGLFSVVSIINEIKRGLPTDDIKFNPIEFSRNFYQISQDKAQLFDLPRLRDSQDYINSILGEYSIENSRQVMLLLEGEQSIGKSSALRDYALIQQNNGVPVYYIDLTSHKDLSELNNIIKPQNIYSLEETIERYNSKGKYPVIIIDTVENAFTNENKLVPYYCQICSVLKDIYNSKKLSIIFVSQESDVKEKLLLNNGFEGRLVVKEFLPRKYETFKNYLLKEINSKIKNETYQFNENNTLSYYQILGSNFKLIDRYVKNTTNSANVSDYVNYVIQETKMNIQSQKDLKDLFSAMIDLMLDQNSKVVKNQYIPYSSLREKDIEFLSNKIDSAQNLKLIVSWKGKIKFKNNLILNSTILSFKDPKNFNYKISDEL